MGYQCKGPGGCTEEVCSKGDTKCIVDLVNCPSIPPPPPPNDPPVAVINCSDDPSNPPPCNIYTGENITLDGSGSDDPDPGEFIVNYSFNIPSLSRSQNSVDSDLSLTNPAVGEHRVDLIVTNNKGVPSALVSEDFKVIQALTADFETESGEWEFLRGDTIHFLDKSIPQDRVATRNWTFIDVEGAELIDASTEKDPFVQFDKPGKKDITLEVCDGLGDCDDITKSVNVKIPMPKWKETHPKTENIFDDPFLIFASLIEYLEG